MMSQMISLVADNMVCKVRKFFGREEGATMVEYGLMVALIAVVVMVIVATLGNSISDMFTEVNTRL
jgi:pilus assembly protein Flp/PilA